ncbi:MAG: POTRA domain-containing protein [Bacteroidota bacterium]|nr:POTRA domain-containing protein [Bacteroidota bacterium]
MKTFFLIIFFFASNNFLQSNNLPLQQTPDAFIDSVIILGNNKTKSFVILREMKLKPGSVLTDEAIDYDKKRIYSLQLFNSVEIFKVETTQPKYNLLVVVTERWFLYPIPIFGIKDRDWKKIYYGAGIVDINFRGRNEKIFAIGTLGYEPSLQLSYRNPQIDYWEDVFVNTSFGYYENENKSLSAQNDAANFFQYHTSASISIGKRFQTSHTAWIHFGYEVVKLSDYQPGRLLNAWGKDAFPIFSTGYNYDTRDLNDYTLFGSYINFHVSKFGLFEKNIDYWKYSFDYRRFIPLIPDVVLAFRSFGTFSSGEELPSYKHVYFGYSERIRGHYKNIYEGENVLGSSAELRIVLLQPQYFNLDFMPMPEFSVWKFGIAAALFGDAGNVWYRKQPLAIADFKKGYGAGLHFMLSYHFVFRAEYALNELRKGEFIFDISAAF